jgi:hypothetical protein
VDLNWPYLAAEPAGFLAGALLVRRAPDAVWERSGLLIRVFALLSAAGAVASGVSPTGWLPLDVVLLAAFGALAVGAGSLVGPALLLATGTVAALAGTGSVAFPLALAAAGLAFASLMDDEPPLNAAAGGLIAQAALRLTDPGGRGQTALVAAAIMLCIFGAAIRWMSAEERRILKRVALGAGLFSVAGAVVAGLAAWSTVDSLRRGLDVASAAVSSDVGGDTESTATELAAAGKDFADARRVLDAWWVRPAAVVPVVAQHWRVLRAAAVTGDQLARAGENTLRAPALADVRVTDGQIPLDRLEAIAPSVEQLAGRLTDGRRRLSSARSSLLVPPLFDRLNSQLDRLTQIERTTQSVGRALPLLPGLLGRDGPRRYFLAVQTPAEARASGGYIGNFGEIVADNGRLSLARFGRPQELNEVGRNERQLVAPEDFAARYARFGPAGEWANINLSPDFPTDAHVIAGLYPQSGGAPLDGVIAVDPAGLAAFLKLLGAVTVPGWPVPITADNAEQIMLHDQYVVEERQERIEFLGAVAQETWGRLTSGVLPPPQHLLATLAPAVRGKHLLLSSTRPEEQRLFEDIGASGRIAPVRGDFLGLVTQNASANKIDYFLHRGVDYRVELDPGSGRLQATVNITLMNDAPSSGLPPTVIGNEVIPPKPPDGDNKLYLSLYTPWDLQGARLDGAAVELEEATELGRRVYSTGLVVKSKGSLTLELRLSGRLPSDLASYRLDLYRQPVVHPDEVSATVVLNRRWEVSGGGREWSTTRRLEADETIEVPLRRR